MTPETRAAWKTFARGYCGAHPYVKGYAARLDGRGEAGVAMGVGNHTRGSRRIFNVCLPNVTKDLRLGIFPVTEVRDASGPVQDGLQPRAACTANRQS